MIKTKSIPFKVQNTNNFVNVNECHLFLFNMHGCPRKHNKTRKNVNHIRMQRL